MSELYETIKSRITQYTKEKDPARRDAYRFLKGKLDLMPSLTDDAATKVIRSLQKDAKKFPGQFTEIESQEMASLVPALMDADQTLAALDEAARQAIKDAPVDARALGVAMGKLKGQPVDSDVVKEVVTQLRTVSE